MVGDLAHGTFTRSLACGTGLVCQLAKLVQDIGPMPGGGGACVNARVTKPTPGSSSAGFAIPDSRRVAIIFSLTAGWVSTRLRLIASGSK